MKHNSLIQIRLIWACILLSSYEQLVWNYHINIYVDGDFKMNNAWMTELPLIRKKAISVGAIP